MLCLHHVQPIVKPVQAQPLASAVPTCSVADAKDAAGAGLTTDPSTPKGQQKHLSGVYVMQGLPQAGATQKSRFAAREQVHRLLAMTVIVIAAVRGGVVWAAALTCWVTCAVAQASDAPPRPLAVCCTPVLASMVTWWLMRGPRVQGDSSTTDYRVFLQQEGKDISSWHDIPLRNADGTLNFVCEIPKETAAKMEVATVSRPPPSCCRTYRQSQVHACCTGVHDAGNLRCMLWSSSIRCHTSTAIVFHLQ